MAQTDEERRAAKREAARRCYQKTKEDPERWARRQEQVRQAQQRMGLEYYRANSKKRRQKKPVPVMLKNIERRAKLFSYEFDLTLEFLERLIAPMVCSVTGVALSFSTEKNHPWLPSVDRVDSNRGYTQDNVRITCWLYNRAKGDGDDAAVLQMARSLLEKHGKNREPNPL